MTTLIHLDELDPALRELNLVIPHVLQSCAALAERMEVDYDSAQDVAQDAAIAVSKAVAAGTLSKDDPDKMRAYAYTVAHNRCMDLFTGSLRREAAEARDERFEGLQSRDGTPDGQMDANDVKRVVSGAVAQLPEAMRNAFLLHHKRRMDDEEIAAELGITVGSAGQYVVRAYNRLRQALEKAGIDVPEVLHPGRARAAIGKPKVRALPPALHPSIRPHRLPLAMMEDSPHEQLL